jgi:hypothetical protein
MHPGWRAAPRRRSKRSIPCAGRGVHVEEALPRSESPTNCGVPLGQRAPVLARLWRPGGVDSTQSEHELGKRIHCGRRPKNVVKMPGSSLDPSEDRPRQGILLGRASRLDRLRNREWKPRSEPRQPSKLSLERLSPTRDARQSDSEIVPKPVDDVDGARRGEPPQPATTEIWKLVVDEPAHQDVVDLEFIRVHRPTSRLPQTTHQESVARRPSAIRRWRVTRRARGRVLERAFGAPLRERTTADHRRIHEDGARAGTTALALERLDPSAAMASVQTCDTAAPSLSLSRDRGRRRAGSVGAGRRPASGPRR